MHDDAKKSPLDHRSDAGRAHRAERYADIARKEGEGPGEKEMAMTRRKRDEKSDGALPHRTES